MKFIKLLLIIFISINSPIKADLNENLVKELKKGGKIIFIRHAYAPGTGDPNNFDINDCSTQRNLNEIGRKQSKKIKELLKNKKIFLDNIYSSEWCRCKETASIIFNKFETKNFLNSFYSTEFSKNKTTQIKNLKNFLANWDGKQNLVFITHYVLIYEVLNYAPSSGEVIITNKDLKMIGKFSDLK